MLSLKQQLFLRFYLGEASSNGTKAAAMAGYHHPEVAASKLLRLVKVQEAIRHHVSHFGMSPEETISRIANLARSDMGDFLLFDPDGTADSPVNVDLSKAKRRHKLGNIKKLKQTTRKVKDGDKWVTERSIELELFEPIKPLALLAKYHGLLTEKFEVEVSADVKGMPDDELIRRATGALEGSGPTRADPGSQAPDVP